jgi:predicted RNA-binding protein with PIN domain
VDEAPQRLVVDGMNVLGSRPDGWWRNREAAMGKLTARLAAMSRRDGVEIVVAFDGEERESVRSAGRDDVEVRFAPGGPDAADREIVRLLRADPDPGSILVITSDRRLRASVKAAGARGAGSSRLHELLAASEERSRDR